MLLCCCHDLLGSRLHQYLLHYIHLHNAYLSPEATLLLKVNKVSGSEMQARKVKIMKFFKGILKKRVANGNSTTHTPHDNHNTHVINILSWLLLHIIIG